MHLHSRLDDLKVLYDYSDCTIEEVYNYLKSEGNREAMKEILIAMHENRLTRDDNFSDLDLDDVCDSIMDSQANYGLCFDYVESDEETEDYFRYQFSWGGPSDELRIYENGSLEYVYLDWFVGVGFNVTKDETMQAVKTFFDECGMLDFCNKREKLYC